MGVPQRILLPVAARPIDAYLRGHDLLAHPCHREAAPPMPDDISRRTFGQLLGAVAIGGALPDLRNVPSVAEHATVSAEELCDLTAVELASRIRRKQVSVREVMTAHLARIERVNPKINAIITLVAERAMADAKKADELQARGGAL